MMRRILGIALAMLAMLACVAQAAPVTVAQAKAAAKAWIAQNGGFVPEGLSTSSAVPRKDGNGVILWYRVNLSDGTCLAMSPVTELEPVIAVVENVPAEGLSAEHPMLAMLQADMADRLRKLGLYEPASSGTSLMAASSSSVPPERTVTMSAWAEQGRARWAELGVGTGLMESQTAKVDDITTEVSVLKGFEKDGPLTHWNQGNAAGGYCYNYYTPGHSVCGCVATAMSAVMQYFAVSGCEAGQVGPNGQCRYNNMPVNAVTKGGDYDWSLFSEMTKRADYNTLTDDQRELLGRVAYDAGVGVCMYWAADGSGASTANIASALKKQYGFKDARAVDSPKEADYAKLIYNQCRAGAPVVLGIAKNGVSVGHAVVAVGYGIDAGGAPRVRVFTGWGGSGDGWYALPYIDTNATADGDSVAYDIIRTAITMIGYETDETIPVVGRVIPAGPGLEVELVGVPNATEEADGETGEGGEEGDGEEAPAAGQWRTITTGNAGYFATRVSASLAGKTIEVKCSGKAATVAIGADAAEATGGAVLGVALPDEVMFMLLENTSWEQTFDAAIATALREGKAILRVSLGGNASNVTDRVIEMDKNLENGFPGKFVYQSADAQASSDRDGDPSFAVFLPQASTPDSLWTWYNGRLAYGYGYEELVTVMVPVTNDVNVVSETAVVMTNMGFRVDYIAADGTAGVTNFPYAGEEERVGQMLAAFQLVLDEGYAAYLRATAGITLAVAMEPVEAGTSSPACGVYVNTLTNGQEVTATAAGELTNEVAGVVMGCTGWTLTRSNTVTGVVSEPEENEGATATFTVSSNEYVSLVWNVSTNAVYISVADQDDGEWGTTSPGSGWYPFGEEIVFVATPAEGFSFGAWSSGTAKPLPESLDALRKWPVLAFSAEEPLALYATYGRGATPGLDATGRLKVVSCVFSYDEEGEPQVGDALSDANLPGFTVAGLPGGSVRKGSMGATLELPAIPLGVSLATNAFVDASGNTWECVGWQLSNGGTAPEGQEAYGTALLTVAANASPTLTWLWMVTEYGPDDPDDPDDPEDAVPPDGLAIMPNADGTLTVRADITNAVKGHSYSLVSAAELAGPYETVLATADATADGALTLVAEPFTPSETKRFYKIVVDLGE